jgi:hypothetical protein
MTVASGEVTREVPVMPGGRRVLGHALEFGRDPLALFQQAREHGDVVRIRFGPFRFFVLNSPSVIRQALVGEARKLGKGLNFGRAKRLIGNPVAQRYCRSLAATARRRRHRAPCCQQHPGTQRTTDHRDPPRLSAVMRVARHPVGRAFCRCPCLGLACGYATGGPAVGRGVGARLARA